MQAILILAHKNVDQVIGLSKILKRHFNVYVHFDTKTSITEKQKKELKNHKINFYSKYDIKWGSFSIVQATIFLMREALKEKENTYFHLISGQDWPLKDTKDIYEYFEYTDKIYMNYWKAIDMKKKGEPEIWWIKYYFNYDQINRRTIFGKIYHRFLLLVETILKVDKLKKYNINKNDVYAGQEWVDVPRDALIFALDYFDNNPNLKKVMATSFCSDEIWLQTILCNSLYSNRIDKNIHRFIIEHKKNGSFPAILDEKDYESIVNSDCFWGRKFQKPISDNLINKLRIFNDYE